MNQSCNDDHDPCKTYSTLYRLVTVVQRECAEIGGSFFTILLDLQNTYVRVDASLDCYLCR